MFDVPAEPLGVPAITPVDAVSVSPAGSVPETMLQVYGEIPPDAPRVTLYGMPTVPLGSEVVVMTKSASSMTTVTAADAVFCRLSVTCTLKEYRPSAVGVPVTDPSEPSVNPVGRVPPVWFHV
jgi:hypothetical protein